MPKRQIDPYLKYYIDYPFTAIKNTGCGTYGQETKIKEIDSMSEWDFFTNNDYIGSILSHTFLYEVFLKRNNIMKLYTIENHGYNSADCDGIEIESLQQEIEIYNNFYYTLNFIIIVMGVMWFFDI